MEYKESADSSLEYWAPRQEQPGGRGSHCQKKHATLGKILSPSPRQGRERHTRKVHMKLKIDSTLFEYTFFRSREFQI